MRRLLMASLILSGLLTATTTFAADENAAGVAPALTAVAGSLTPRADVAADRQLSPRSFEPRRPMILPALYGVSALLQGYDAYSTLTVLKHGGVEANPLMKGLTGNPAAFIGLKAGISVLSVVAAERMWKHHNRVGAVVTMAVSNSLMAMVATHNARVLQQVR